MHEKQSIWKKLISRTLGNKKTQSVTIPVFCVLIGLIAGAVVIAVLGLSLIHIWSRRRRGSRKRTP